MEPNLFSCLHRWLHRQDENFVTEAFAFVLAHLLECEADLGKQFVGWLCDADPSKTDGAAVKTQVHTDKGIPDIEIAGPGFCALVEAKKRSGVGPDQIRRYRKILAKCEAACKKLILVTLYPLDESEDQPDRHVYWSDVADWLHKNQASDAVSQYLVKQFVDFLKEQAMTIEKVEWQYLEGMKAANHLIAMLAKAIKLAGIPVYEKSRWGLTGYYVDKKRFWAGIEHDWPEAIQFSFWEATHDPKRFKALKKGEVYENTPYFWLDLTEEDVHFFSRSAEGQLAVIKSFLEQSWKDAKACELPNKKQSKASK
ncbi:MAG: hypothetical protein U0793_03445 [Gemmataceae bacterium]